MIAPAGRRLGKFEIRQKLGRGGMADVYLALDGETAQTVALKLIEHSSDADTRDAIEAERRGAELQARLAAIDPHVVRVYQSGDLDGFFFVAMEFIDGLTLRELLDLRRTVPLDVALSIAWTVAEALRHAHLHGIIHRDVKPANILISHAGQVKLLDFGVARFENQSDLTMPGMVVGTTSYMSAEQAKGEELDERSDLYSLALCAYESLSGRHPFRKDQPEASLTALLTKTAAPLWRIRPGTPWSVSRLVSATLSRDRRRRPRDASEFLSRLDRCLGRAGQDREAYLAAYMAAVRAGRKFASPLPRKGVALWWYVAVGAVLGLAAGLGAAWR